MTNKKNPLLSQCDPSVYCPDYWIGGGSPYLHSIESPNVVAAVELMVVADPTLCIFMIQHVRDDEEVRFVVSLMIDRITPLGSAPGLNTGLRSIFFFFCTRFLDAE